MNNYKKNILITGCSSGIGFATAKLLSNNGWQVFATCRKKSDVRKLINLGYSSFLLDYRDEKSIEKSLKEILSQTNGNLTALFNNGAYALPGALEDVPVEAMRQIFETNVFGWHHLTRRVIPIMKKQGYGRIIQCSSILGFITLAYRGPYNSTKWALEALSDTLRIELDKTNIHVISIRPGPINTKIKSNSTHHFERWINWQKSHISKKYEDFLIPRLYEKGHHRFELEAEEVAKKVLTALESKNPKLVYNVTIPTYFMSYLIRLLPKSFFHKVLKFFSDPV